MPRPCNMIPVPVCVGSPCPVWLVAWLGGWGLGFGGACGDAKQNERLQGSSKKITEAPTKSTSAGAVPPPCPHDCTSRTSSVLHVVLRISLKNVPNTICCSRPYLLAPMPSAPPPHFFLNNTQPAPLHDTRHRKFRCWLGHSTRPPRAGCRRDVVLPSYRSLTPPGGVRTISQYEPNDLIVDQATVRVPA